MLELSKIRPCITTPPYLEVYTMRRYKWQQNSNLTTIFIYIFSINHQENNASMSFVTFETPVVSLSKLCRLQSSIITVTTTNLDPLHFLPLVTTPFTLGRDSPSFPNALPTFHTPIQWISIDLFRDSKSNPTLLWQSIENNEEE